jgi:tetratricopeptide (TPR) repeat protein
LVQLGAKSFIFRRESLTAEVLRLVRQDTSPIVLLQGLVGSGKATLLGEVARELADEFPYALVIKFDGPAALEPSYFLEEINDFLTVVGRGIAQTRLREQNLQSTLDTLVAQLADLRVLVLPLSVDSAQPSWLDLLLERFVTLEQVRVIATALHRPRIITQATVVSVPPLSDTEAVAFAREYARAFNLNVEPEGLLVRLPASVRSHPQALTTLLAHLHDVPSELLLFEGIPEDARAPVRLIEQVITVLSEEERNALALTELLAEMELARVFLALNLTPPAGFVTAVRALMFKSLIYRVGEAYAVPAIVNEALGAAASGPRDAAASSVGRSLRQAIVSLIDTGEHPGTLAAISARIAQRFKEQRRWELIRELIDERYLELLNVRGYWKEYSLLLRVGAEATANLNDKLARFRLNCRLARKLLQMGEGAEAQALLREIEKYQIADTETLDSAEAHSHRALLYTMSGKDEDALEELAESRRIRLALGDINGLAITENLTGNIHLRRKDYVLARQAYVAALARFTDRGSRYLVDAETGLATCDLREGLPEEAEERLRRAMTHCQQFNYDAAMPRVLYTLALVLESRRQSAKAAGLAREAAEKAKTTDPRLAMMARLLARRLEMMSSYN